MTRRRLSTSLTPVSLPLFLLFQLCFTAQGQSVALPAALHLEGAPNFRDIGGLQTADGRRVRSGRLFRSGQLASLTAADYAALAPLGIRVVFDLRSEGERADAPTKWRGSPAPEFVAAPMGFGAMPVNASQADMMRQFAATLKTPDDARAMMTGGMAELTDSGRAEMAKILLRLSEGGAPAVVHCTAGKDRTGLFTAVLLTILGVPHDRVMEDYLRSNRALASGGALPPGTQLPLDPQILRPLMAVEPDYLEASFRRIGDQWGSFDEYRRKGLGVTDAEAEKLRAMLLEAVIR